MNILNNLNTKPNFPSNNIFTANGIISNNTTNQPSFGINPNNAFPQISSTNPQNPFNSVNKQNIASNPNPFQNSSILPNQQNFNLNNQNIYSPNLNNLPNPNYTSQNNLTNLNNPNPNNYNILNNINPINYQQNQNLGFNTNQENLYGNKQIFNTNIQPFSGSNQNLQYINYQKQLNLIDPQNQLNLLINKKEVDKKEIIDVVQSYLNCLNKTSRFNSFKYMLYNRVTDDSLNYINFLQQPKYQDFTDEGEPFLIDQELWQKALRNNPDPNLFYPSQICSPKALDSRAKILEILEFQKLEYLMNLKDRLNKLSSLYENEINNINSTIKNKLNLIKHKQMNVVYKIEKLAIILGKAKKDYNIENKINLKLNDLKNLISNKDSYINRLKNLSSLSTLISFDNVYETEEDPLKDYTKERFGKNILVLKNMKKIFDLNFSKLRKCQGDLNYIKNDLDDFNKYGRINK